MEIHPAVVRRRRFVWGCAPGEYSIHMIRRDKHAFYGMASIGAYYVGWLYMYGRRGWEYPLSDLLSRNTTKENYTSSIIPTNLD